MECSTHCCELPAKGSVVPSHVVGFLDVDECAPGAIRAAEPDALSESIRLLIGPIAKAGLCGVKSWVYSGLDAVEEHSLKDFEDAGGQSDWAIIIGGVFGANFVHGHNDT